MPSTIPIVDLRDRSVDVAATIDHACRTVGFFVLVGHGIEAHVVDEAWTATVGFFERPASEKQRACHTDARHPYGYFAPGGEALARSRGEVTPPDLKESFNLAPPRHHGGGRFAGGPRIWPNGVPGFEAAWTAYYDAMSALADRLMDAFALALTVDPAVFRTRTRRHLGALRGLHYPPVVSDIEPDQLRAGAHTDYGTLTVLLPGPGTGGLEVLHPDRGWIPVQAPGGGFVVNIGDVMAMWTNDRWRSTLHRVALPDRDVAAHERRYAMAFFHQPDADAEIVALPTCVDDEHPARYPPVVFGAWLGAKFDRASSINSDDDGAEAGGDSSVDLEQFEQ